MTASWLRSYWEQLWSPPLCLSPLLEGGAGRGGGGRWALELGHRRLISHPGSWRLLTLEVQQHCAEAQVGVTRLLSAAVGSCVFAVGGAGTHGGWGRCHPGLRMSMLYIVHPALFKDVFWTYLGHSRQISSIHFKITSLNSNMLSQTWLTALVFKWELHKHSFSQQKAVNLRAYDGDKSLWTLANGKWLQTTGAPTSFSFI